MSVAWCTQGGHSPWATPTGHRAAHVRNLPEAETSVSDAKCLSSLVKIVLKLTALYLNFTEQLVIPCPCMQRGTATVSGQCSSSHTPLRSTTPQALLSTSTSLLPTVHRVSHPKPTLRGHAAHTSLECDQIKHFATTLCEYGNLWQSMWMERFHMHCYLECVLAIACLWRDKRLKFAPDGPHFCRFIESALASVDRSMNPWVVLSELSYPCV